MKVCPACKTLYQDTETVCPDCWSHQILLESPQTVLEISESLPVSVQTAPERLESLPEKRGYFQFTIDFFSNNLNLFSILGIIVTILTLFPLFVTFILGDNWFNLLLGDPTIGFQSLLLIWIATFFGAAFVYYLIALVIIDFINQIRRAPNLHIAEIFFAFAILSLAIISIGSLIAFLWLVWFTKFDLVIYFYGLHLLLLTMIPAFIVIISGFIHAYSDCLNDPVFSEIKKSLTSGATGIKDYVNNSRVKNLIFSAIRLLSSKISAIRNALMFLLIILMTVAVAYFFYFLIFNWIIPISGDISAINNEMSKYYSNKEVSVRIHYDILNQSNATPILLSVQREIDINSTKNWSGFDEGYAQCHWSTNFGYFITTNSDNSTITKHTQTLIIPRCLKNKDSVLWTYDLTYFNKTKPTVMIGLTLEDQNKILKMDGNGVLGKANLSASWSNFDTLRNESLNFTNNS